MKRNVGCLAVTVGLMGCSDAGQVELYYPATATPVVASPLEVGEWTVTLEQASVLFGPVYLCAAATGAATLCSTAMAEIRREVVVDLANPLPQSLGDVHGFSGTIRSGSYDHGIHWFVTETEARADNLTLGGHSAVFVGKAQRGGQTVAFDAHIDVPPPIQGERAVTRIFSPVTIDSEDVALDMRFDVATWLGAIDFDNAATTAGPLVITPDSAMHSSLVNVISNLAPPEFVWSGSGKTTP